MSWARIRNWFRPWASLALGTAGFFVAHQIGSNAVFENCRTGSPWMVILGGLAGLLVIGVGAFGSWPVYARTKEAPARRLIAGVGLLASILFAVGVILALIAALVIPRCWA